MNGGFPNLPVPKQERRWLGFRRGRGHRMDRRENIMRLVADVVGMDQRRCEREFLALEGAENFAGVAVLRELVGALVAEKRIVGRELAMRVACEAARITEQQSAQGNLQGRKPRLIVGGHACEIDAVEIGACEFLVPICQRFLERHDILSGTTHRIDLRIFPRREFFIRFREKRSLDHDVAENLLCDGIDARGIENLRRSVDERIVALRRTEALAHRSPGAVERGARTVARS